MPRSRRWSSPTLSAFWRATQTSMALSPCPRDRRQLRAFRHGAAVEPLCARCVHPNGGPTDVFCVRRRTHAHCACRAASQWLYQAPRSTTLDSSRQHASSPPCPAAGRSAGHNAGAGSRLSARFKISVYRWSLCRNTRGAMFRDKRWTRDGWRELAAALADRGLTVVATGSPDEAERSYLDDLWNGMASVRRLDGPSWPEVAALLSAARVFVGPDTSVTHLAAAKGCATVALYGPTDPGYGDLGRSAGSMCRGCRGALQRRGNVWLVQNPLPCTPCRNEGCERRLDSYSRCLDELSGAAGALCGRPGALSRCAAQPLTRSKLVRSSFHTIFRHGRACPGHRRGPAWPRPQGFADRAPTAQGRPLRRADVDGRDKPLGQIYGGGRGV